MFQRQKTGSVLCASCGQLVGVNDEKCLNCGRRNPSMFGFGAAIRSLGQDMGFVEFVIFMCGVLFIGALILDPSGIRSGGFTLFSPSGRALFLLGSTGYFPVVDAGRWWTLLSAGWLHGGLLHVGFNMYWVRNLAPPTAEFFGVGRMIIIYTVACITGFVFTTVANAFIPLIPVINLLLGLLGLAGADTTVGASGAIFGLLGALVYSGQRTGDTGVYRQAMFYVVFMAIFGIVMPMVDNQAHLGGFVGGYVAAKFLDPLKREQGDHLVIALLCLAASVLSVAASFVTGLKYFPAS